MGGQSQALNGTSQALGGLRQDLGGPVQGVKPGTGRPKPGFGRPNPGPGRPKLEPGRPHPGPGWPKPGPGRPKLITMFRVILTSYYKEKKFMKIQNLKHIQMSKNGPFLLFLAFMGMFRVLDFFEIFSE